MMIATPQFAVGDRFLFHSEHDFDAWCNDGIVEITDVHSGGKGVVFPYVCHIVENGVLTKWRTQAVESQLVPLNTLDVMEAAA